MIHDDKRSTVIVIAILCVLTLGSVVFLSDTSLYWIHGISGVSLDIATMLTPWGLLKNVFLRTSYVLRPLYDEPADRLGLFQDPAIRAGVSLTVGSALALLAIAYRRVSGGSEPLDGGDETRRTRDFKRVHDLGRGSAISDPSQDNGPQH